MPPRTMDLRSLRAQTITLALLLISFGFNGPGSARILAQDSSTKASVRRLTVEECIAIGLENQPAIGAKQAALGAADEQRKIARSYFFPQVNLTTRLAHFDEHQSVDFPSPISGALADVTADGAAFFNIARQAGSAAALAAIDNPNTPLFPGGPTFNSARQTAIDNLPESFKVDVLGETFLTNEFLLTQPLWTGGKVRFRHQQAQLGVRAADVDKSRQQTIFNVTRAYQSILLAGETIQVGKETHGQFHAIERLVSNLVEHGDEYVTTADRARARTLSKLAENEIVRLEHLLELAHAGLKQAMGVDARFAFVLADEELQVREEKLDWADVLQRALSRRPELIKTQVGIDVAELDRRLAIAQFHPDVVLFGSFSTIHDNRNFANPNDPEQWAVGVGVDVPLFAAGRRFARSRRANHQQTQARYVSQLARDLIALEAREAYLQHKETSERLDIAAEAARSAQESLDRFYDQFIGDQVKDEDMAEYFEDRQQARLLLTRAQVLYNQTRYAYIISLARIQLVTASP